MDSKSQTTPIKIKNEPKDPPSNRRGTRKSTASDKISSPAKLNKEGLPHISQTKTGPKMISNVIIQSKEKGESLRREDVSEISGESELELLGSPTIEIAGGGIENDDLENLNALEPHIEEKMLLDDVIPVSEAERKLEAENQENNNSKTSIEDSMEIEIPTDGRQVKIRILNNLKKASNLLNDLPGLCLILLKTEYIGYVDFISQPENTARNGRVMKIVLNNYSRRRMMVTAWNNEIPMLEEISEIGNVIYAHNLLVKIKEDKTYNRGSGSKYFQAQEIFHFEILGMLDVLPKDCGISCIDFDCIDEARGLIRIEGIIKTAPRLQKSKKYGNKLMGGITNGKQVIEFQLDENQETNHILKGERVQIQGNIVKKNNGLHFIKVVNSSDIQKLSDRPIEDLLWFLEANEHL
ncbi:hypothetical protein QAD02_020263 [Eretmocerus hayati]|uniref:Uncharacterized protein n=1 Tax=Eretmocerus hayati TaxID=131215 RepID=A0ACC2PLV8_9HYME|nr:hypothetical protein QAD02_020263 [Eretmocerus hayati]